MARTFLQHIIAEAITGFVEASKMRNFDFSLILPARDTHTKQAISANFSGTG